MKEKYIFAIKRPFTTITYHVHPVEGGGVRIKPFVLSYVLLPEIGADGNLHKREAIKEVQEGEEISFSKPFQEFCDACSKWQGGTMIQHAFPFLTSDERDKLMFPLEY